VYGFQRTLTSQGIQVDKKITSNGASLEMAMEGADKVVYFTHDYTSMCPDKNDFLIGTSKLAKKLGVKSLVAVCPVEHDMAYTEDANRSWVQVRQDAEKTALQSSNALTILNTDLVFSNESTHLLHYIAQCVNKGKIPRGFLQGDVNFKPVHSDDVANAVAHMIANPGHGQFALQGDKSVSLAEIVNLIEKASGKAEGQTSAQRFNNPMSLIDEFWTGLTVSQNMLNLVLDSKDECVMTEAESFWQAKGLAPQHDIEAHFAQNPVD
jgi:uncharacterized protein YbjT (DUF2867 family)